MKKFILYVEGKDDLAFLFDFIKARFSEISLEKEGDNICILKPSNNLLLNLEGEGSFVNEVDDIKRRTQDGFSVLVIADADKSKTEKEKFYNSFKEKHGIDFELFLVGDENGKGAIERLKEKIIKEEFRPLSECFKKFNECLKSEHKNFSGYVVPHPFNSVKTYFDKFIELAKSKGKNPNVFDFEHNSLDDLYHLLSKYLIES